MNELHPIFQALELLKDGDKEFDNQDFSKALSLFLEAMKIADKIPDSEWDKVTFLATCNARLSGAYGRLEKIEQSLKCSNLALERLDKVGHLYPVEFGWWFAAKFNKGASLTALGRKEEALQVIYEVKNMLSASAEHNKYRAQCDYVITLIKDLADKDKRKWWKIW